MNRKIYFLACALSLFRIITPVYGQTFYEKYFKDGTYVFDGIEKIRQADIFTTHKSEFGLGIHDEMIQTNNVVTEEGKLTTKYIMKHKGIPVEGSMMNVIGDKGIVLYANGFLRTGLDVDKDNIISQQDAIDAAIDYVGATKYAWEDTALENSIKALQEDSTATYYPKASLIITKKRGEDFDHSTGNYQLCYTVHIEAVEPALNIDIFVNANDGSIFTEQLSNYEAYHTLGSLWTWYDGAYNDLHTTTCALCTNYKLLDLPRNMRTAKYQAKTVMMDNNNSWVNNDQKTGASAHWYAGKAWDFYNAKGRAGSNYAKKEVVITVDAVVNGNAAYKPDTIYNVDRILVRPDDGTSGATFDIIAHEYTHAMVYESSGLGKLGDFEARSMNEGYADIFGMKIEGDVLGWHDWEIGEDLGVGVKRSFANPNADQSQYSTNNGANKGGSAAYYMQSGYWSATNYHANAGLMRKWFHLLSNGGTFNGNTVSGLGINTADAVAYITFNWWLWSNVSYPDMAKQTEHATIAHYGRCSNEHKQVVNSLRAVGFNVPVPFCGGIRLCCGTIIDVRDSTPPGDGIGEWTADIDEGISTSGDFVWHIPDGWSAVAEGNKLTLLSHADNSSKMLSVSYTVDGTTYTDSVAVHFSDEEWEPTATPPVEPDSRPILREEESVFNGLTLYPNPANNTIQVSIRSFEDKATIEIYNVSGSLIKAIEINSANADINTSDLTNGLYFIKARTGDRVFVRKLSVIH